MSRSWYISQQRLGFRKNISIQDIMTGKTLNYKRHLEIPFVNYYQIHEKDTPQNTSTNTSREGRLYFGSFTGFSDFSIKSVQNQC